MFRILFFLCLVFFGTLLAHEEYYLCFDGGGSKTRVSLLNQNGQLMQLSYKNRVGDTILLGSSNIMQIGKENLNALLNDIFTNIFVIAEKKPLENYIKNHSVVGGFAGVPREPERKSVEELFLAHGCNPEKLQVKCDAVLSSEIAAGGGISLISGTGMACIAMEEGNRIQAAGFGRLLDDRGSGYAIGREAARASLKQAHGYGEKTILTDILMKRFSLLNPLDLITLIHSRLSPAEIASIAEDVFSAAYEKNDRVAEEILREAARELASCVSSVYKRLDNPNGELYVWGSILHNQFADQFLPMILENLDEGVSLTIQNREEEDATVVYVRKKLIGKE